ncbi:biotin transporter BioY [Candidatus Neomarinimicrobiota bacterium]
MTYSTYADLIRPITNRQAWLYNAILVIGGSLLIAVSAQLAVRLPFSPIPITGQTLIVLLAGALLGPLRGGVTVLLYLVEGASGLPVFASGGLGVAYLLGPTGGYLFGFVGAAVVTGYLAERGWDRRFLTTVAAMVLGTVVIYLTGVTWLAFQAGTENALSMGLYPFLPGAILKITAAAFLLPQGWKILDR